MNIPSELIAAFPPNPDLWLRRLSGKIDDDMLQVIAEADYGLGADEALAVLRTIRDQGGTHDLKHSDWAAIGEVLTLTIYSDPDRPNPPPFKPGPAGVRGHHTRLFAGALLLQYFAGAEPDSFDNDDSTLASCLISAHGLGIEINEAIGSYLTWWLSRIICPERGLFFSLALLIVATRHWSGQVLESALGATAEWVMDIEAQFQQEFLPDTLNPRPLAFSLLQGFWAPLAAEILAAAAGIEATDVRENLQLCSLLLDSGWSA